MLTLALLVLAQSQNPPESEVFRTRFPARVRRAGGRSGAGLAFFEAFPIGGAGAGAVVPLANWTLRSEEFDAWSTFSTGVAVPTITANQATNPIDGTLTADRLQVPSTAIAQGSWTFPSSGLTSIPGTATCSVYVRGNSTSGTIDLCIDNPVTCAACVYTGAWSRCSVTGANTAPASLYVGNMSQVAFGNTARAAQDVFVFGGMCNAGSTAAPYVRTTTVAALPFPTGARGETLTFTRASTAIGTITASGGLATTGIANGDLRLVPANMPRVSFDSAGTLGLLAESSRTNSILRSEQIDDAVWSKFSTATVPTPNTVVAPDGTTTGDLVVVGASPTSTTSVHEAMAVTNAVQYVCTGYVRSGSGSGTVWFNLGNNLDFSTAFVSTPCSINSTSWTRCQVTRTATSAAHGLYVGSSPSIPTNIAANFDFTLWGAQCEEGAFATSYNPATSAAVTRAAEAASFTIAAMSSAAGLSWASSVQHPSANGGVVWGASTGLVQDATNRTQLYRANTNVQTCDYFSTAGARGATNVAVYTENQLYRQACSYSGAGASSTLSSYRDGVLGTTSAPSTTGAISITTVIPCALGDAPSIGPADGICSRVCADPSPARCR